MTPATQPNLALVFVHGSWHSPEHFGPIIKAVQSRHSYKCTTVALPSTQTPETPAASLADDIAAIRTVVLEELEVHNNNVVIVAHSYGGCPTNTALESLTPTPRKASGHATSVRGIAFMNAIPMPAGVSFFSHGLRNTLHPIHDLRSTSNGDFCWVGAPGPEHYFYNTLTPSETSLWAGKLKQQSWKAYTDITTHAAYLDEGCKCWYLSCGMDQAFPVQAQKALVEEANGRGAQIQVVDLHEADHTPFLGDSVEKTVEFIEKVVKESLM